MPRPFFETYIPRRLMRDEEWRRVILADARRAAARMGFRGRISFSWSKTHGGRPIIAVRVWGTS